MRNAGHNNGPALAVRNDNDLDSPSSRTERPPSAMHHTAPVRGAVTLPEPIKVAEFWKNRRGESVRVSLTQYQGHNLLDIRQCFTDPQGKSRFSKKGISVALRKLPDLLKAISRAHAKAIELGLIEAESAP